MRYIFSVFIDKQTRVDMYLSALFPLYSRSYIQKMIDRGQVSVNSKTINKNLKIKNKDEIILEIKNENIEGVLPEKIDLDIVFEDDNILIVNKDPGLNVHPVPGEDGKKNTLVNAVLYHTKEKLPSIGGENRPGIVHRLDKNTSGIIMIAKNDMMMNYLATIIKERKIEKKYIAIVAGIFKNKEFKIESYIGRDPNNRIKMTTKNGLNQKLAITSGKVLGYIDDKYTVLKLNLETGRTHQIRVHLSSIGFPIIGDPVYGNKEVNKEVFDKYSLNRQALHALELSFILYKKEVYFKADLKKDMKKIISNNLINLFDK